MPLTRSRRSRSARNADSQQVRRARRRRIFLETLEDRRVLAAYVWAGTGAQAWTDTAAWIADGNPAVSLPGANDDVTFNGTSVQNVATPNALTTVRSLTIDSGYTGTITLGSDFKANYGLTQAGGTLIAGANTLTVGRDLTVSGGVFNAGTSTVELFAGPVGASSKINAPGVAFKNVTLNLGSHHVNVNTLDVNGNLTLQGFNTFSGTAYVSGNVITSAGGAHSNASSGKIVIDGNGAQQLRTVNPTDTNGFLPSIEINKSGGTLSLSGGLNVQGNWTQVNGALNAGSSTVTFMGGTYTVDTGNRSLNNVVIDTGVHHFNIKKLDVNGDLTIKTATTMNFVGGATTGDLTVAGDLKSLDASVSGNASIVMDGGGHVKFGGPGDFPQGGIFINKSTYNVTAEDMVVPLDSTLTIESLGSLNGELLVGKDVLTKDGSVTGSGYLVFAGTGNQKLRADAAGDQVAGVRVNKTDGTLTLDPANRIGVTGSWYHESGTVNAAGSTVELTGGGHRTVVTGSGMAFNNFIVDIGSYNLSSSSSDFAVDGELTVRSVGAFNGTAVARGNVTSEDTSVPGSGAVVFSGNQNQLLKAAVDHAQVPSVEINKTGGILTLDASNTIGAGGNWHHFAGTVATSGSTVELKGGGHRSVVTGSGMAFNNFIVDIGNYNLSSNSSNMAVDGEFTVRSVGALNATVTARGDVTAEDTGVGGSGVIVFSGNQNQLLKAAVAHGQIPNVEINKTGGTLTLDAGNTIGVTGNWNYVKGALSATGSTVSFEGGGHVSVFTGANAATALANVEIDKSNYNVTVSTRMDVNGSLTINSVGSINAPSGALTVGRDLTSNDSAVGGTADIWMDGTIDGTITAITGDFPNGGIVISKGSAQDVTANVTKPLDGVLKLNSLDKLWGEFQVGNNVITSDVSVGGNGVIAFTGTGNQKLTSTVVGGQVPGVKIDKASGTFTVDSVNPIGVTGSQGWNEVAGNVVTTNSTVEFRGVSKTVNAATPFNNVVVSMGSADTLTAANMIVNGSLTLSNLTGIAGTIEARGNVTTGDTSVGGSGGILFAGNKNQTFSASVDGAQVPNVTINKDGGTLTVAGPNAIGVTRNWTHVNGNVDTTGSTVRFNSTTKTVDDGGYAFNDVVLAMGSADTLNATSMNVNGNLTISSLTGINGLISVYGNVTSTDTGVAGNGVIAMVGGNDATLSGGDLPNGGLVVAKTGDAEVALLSSLSLSSLAVNSGTLEFGTFELNVNGATSVASAGTLSFDLAPVNTQLKVSGGNLTFSDDSKIKIAATDAAFAEYNLVSVSGGSLVDNGVEFAVPDDIAAAVTAGVGGRVKVTKIA